MKKSVALILLILPLLVINCGVGGGIGRDEGPTADSQAVFVDEDSSISITTTASHPVDSPLTWEVVIFPSNGSLAGTDTLPDCTYTPDPHYNGGDSFSFRVSDGYQDSNIAKVDITVNPVNDAPTATSASITTKEDTSVGVTPTVIDVDLLDDPVVDSHIFSILTQPASGAASVLANQLFYTPDPNINGTDSFTYQATDSGSASVIGTATVTVNPVSDAPVLTPIGPKAVAEGATLTFDVSASDADGTTPTVLAAPLPGDATFNGTTFNWTPGFTDAGTYNVLFTASDGSLTDTELVTIVVRATNQAPVANPGAPATPEDTPVVITLSGTDPDGDELTYVVLSTPSNGVLSGTEPTLTYTPAPDWNGIASFIFRASDGSLADTATVTITVNPVNDAPVLDPIGPKAVAEGSTLTFDVSASDVDGPSLTVTAAPLPGGATFNGTTFDWSPDFAQAGTYNVLFTAFDGSLTDTELVTIAVSNTNQAPVLDPIGGKAVAEGALLTFDATASDVDGTTPTVTADPLPVGATFDGTTFNWTPDFAQAGTYDVLFTASDGSLADTELVTIAVSNTNQAPEISGTPDTSAVAGTLYSFTPIASDVDDGDHLSFLINVQPIWAAFDTSTGTLSGTPANADVGTTTTGIVISVTDGVETVGLPAFDLAVVGAAPGAPPALILTTGILFVDIDATGTTADGQSWTDAFNHPQDALDIAQAGDEIWVSEGVYGPRAAAESYVITMVESVDLYGGFSGVEATSSGRDINAHLTVLDGEDNVDVIYGADNARLDGFVITRAMSNGMQNNGVSPTVANCTFEDNGFVGGSNGGAIQNVSGANAYISNSTFVNNSGSAIYNENSSPTINNSDFYNNFGDAGGAIQNRGLNSQPLITNSLFEGNTAAQLGGAIYNSEGEPTLINSTIVGNSAGIDGGGVASELGQGRGPTVINSILWNNSGLEIYDDASSLTSAVYSNIEGGYPGTGNIDLDPSFVDAAAGDYRLGFGSVCIDAGDNSAVSTPFDLIGNPRIGGGIVDMGVYEYLP